MRYLIACFVEIALLLLVSSCAVTVPDVPLCVELHPSKGHCINTISSTEVTIDDQHPHQGETWWDMRPKMIYTPAKSWAALKKFIIEVCRKTKKCDTELGSWDRTVGKIDQLISPQEGASAPLDRPALDAAP